MTGLDLWEGDKHTSCHMARPASTSTLSLSAVVSWVIPSLKTSDMFSYALVRLRYIFAV